MRPAASRSTAAACCGVNSHLLASLFVGFRRPSICLTFSSPSIPPLVTVTTFGPLLGSFRDGFGLGRAVICHRVFIVVLDAYSRFRCVFGGFWFGFESPWDHFIIPAISGNCAPCVTARARRG